MPKWGVGLWPETCAVIHKTEECMHNPLSSSSFSSASVEWILGPKTFTDGPEAPSQVLHYLMDHPEFIKSHSEEAKNALSRVETMNLSEAKMDDSAWRCRAALLEAHPHLFRQDSTIEIRLMGTSQTIPKNDLMMRSPVLRAILSNEAHKAEIDLSQEGVDEATKAAFIHFLKTGQLTDIDDVFSLLFMADKYQVEDLKDKVRVALKEQLTNENVIQILEGAVATHSEMLIADCLHFIAKSQQLLTSEKEEVRALLNSLKKLKESGAKLDLHVDKLGITPEDWSRDYWGDIDTVSKYVPLQLVVKDNTPDNQLIADLLEKLPNLYGLFICNNQKITHLNNLKQIKYLVCMGTHSIKTVEVPKATTVEFYGKSLLSIYAPEAIEFSCGRSEVLETFSVPNARKVTASNLSALKSFSATRTTTLTLRDCQKLSSFEAPEIIDFYGTGCPSIETLELNNAIKIKCSEFSGLTLIKASQASEIDISRSQRLSRVEAPKAKKARLPWGNQLSEENIVVADGCEFSL